MKTFECRHRKEGKSWQDRSRICPFCGLTCKTKRGLYTHRSRVNMWTLIRIKPLEKAIKRIQDQERRAGPYLTRKKLKELILSNRDPQAQGKAIAHLELSILKDQEEQTQTAASLETPPPSLDAKMRPEIPSEL